MLLSTPSVTSVKIEMLHSMLKTSGRNSEAFQFEGHGKQLLGNIKPLGKTYKKPKLSQAFGLDSSSILLSLLARSVNRSPLCSSIISCASRESSFINTSAHEKLRIDYFLARTSFKMHFKATAAITMAAIVSQALSHCVLTSIQGANGVTMPGLSVIDGTPRDCARYARISYLLSP
jgi:hypothetical protein